MAAAEEIGYPVVLKPVDGQASRGVFKVWRREELLAHFDRTASLTRQPYTLVEEVMVGPVTSAESFVRQGEIRIYGVCVKTKCAPPHSYDRRLVYPGRFPDRVHAEIREMNERVIRAIGIRMGITHAEYVVTAAGVRLLEIAAWGCGAPRGHRPGYRRLPSAWTLVEESANPPGSWRRRGRPAPEPAALWHPGVLPASAGASEAGPRSE